MTEMSVFAKTVMEQKYSHKNKEGETESWDNISYRVSKHVLKAVHAPASQIEKTRKIILERKFIPGGRYLAATGRLFHQVNNCFLFCAEDSREGWADLMHKGTLSLMTGGGIGIDYSDVRGEGKLIRKTGGVSTGPVALMQMVNESGRYIMQGGSRRSAIWAGLNWAHPDIQKFIRLKDWSEDLKNMKAKDFNAFAPMDMTNISVLLDDEFFEAFNNEKHEQHSLAQSVYWTTIRHALETGEPGFSIDTGRNSRETLRNACTEITSADDSDVCNLGSINMARIESLEEMEYVVELGTAFLLAGTVYSDIPFAGVDKIRNKNRRLGLGLMGLHEWLLRHGKKYGPDEELKKYLDIYSKSGIIAKTYAKKWELSNPIKTRAIAPNGTIGIIAETTTGVEPIFCAAYKRRYLKGNVWNFQYVVDPTAKNLLDAGVPLELIEDAYDLANDVERRVAFQAWVQQFVDHSISSTINLPKWGSQLNNESKVRDFGNMLLKYLPKLRGITVYPNEARAGQPLNAVPLTEALSKEGHVYEETGTTVCDVSRGGTCGS